ncbi:hypothetical protein K440DRAFT_632448 [Wilcoxina mikolae CBS 423.85]|nr:hypothetical protein K440DRAFT_632448 [Wilcoxina mikolae CBS 423.85]
MGNTPTTPAAEAPYTFTASSQSWTPLSTTTTPPPLPPTTTVNIISWNIDFMTPHHSVRVVAALSHLSTLLPTPPSATIILLQEISPSALPEILNNTWVREHFLISHTTAIGAYFTTTLVSRDLPVAGVRRVPYSSSYMGRDVLLVDIPLSSGSVLRVGNTHLESLRHPGVIIRPRQLEEVVELLKAVEAGVVAGDMNAIMQEDERLPERVGLQDVWELQEGVDEEEGHTWGYQPPQREYLPGRLDKVLFTGSVDVLETGEVEEVGGIGRRLRRVGVGLKYTLQREEGEEDEAKSDWVTDHYGLWVKIRAGIRESTD